jgi:hypothetical protein
MLKANRTYILLLIIFTFAFFYRMLLMLWNGFPPGADIGLHNSVIYSITGHGNVDFFHNFYHMGGGISLTFPGYHIFTSSIILVTGLPDYLAHTMVVSLFSSLVVLAAFLITKRVWSEPGAYIVAFLVAISRFDIEMLMWGGYPNVITLLLIPVTLYLYLQKDRFSKAPFLVTGSILAGSIFLTHSLSAAVFVAIIFLAALLVFIMPKKLGTIRKMGLYWLLPIVFGAILFSPVIVQAVPAYLTHNSSLAPDPTSPNTIDLATISTQTLPLELVLPLFGVLAGFLVFSKKYFGHFLVLPTFLLSMWLFVPLVLTFSYLVGFPIDSNRFLYFLILPLIIFIAVLIEHSSRFFADVVNKFNPSINRANRVVNVRIARFLSSLTHKRIYSTFILFFLLFSFVALPIFMGPVYNVGQSIQQFYQTMDNQGFEAIEWAKTNTPKDAAFVSDALYGWWFGGFAQRPTYSAVDPQYLTINDEYNKTLFARNLLDTDYLMDNGLVQVREDGGYLARHNPEILATLNWTYFPYSFFNFGSNETQIRYRVYNEANENYTPYSVYLDALKVKEMAIKTRVADYNQSLVLEATTTITRGNEYFNCTQQTTVQRGQRFVNLTTTIDSTVPGVVLDWLDVEVKSNGKEQISIGDSKTIALLAEDVKVFGQIIFTSNQPETRIKLGNWATQSTIELQYNLDGKPYAQTQISASAYSITDDLSIYHDQARKSSLLNNQLILNLNPNQPSKNIDFEQVFNYQTEIQSYNVSYIACRVPEMYPKFLKDPSFSLVYMNEAESSKVLNNEIAIFKVNGNLK